MADLFAPLEMGAVNLPNRVLMAPMTRSRSKQPGDVPFALNAEYYRQRASAGLIITEATYVSTTGRGYAFIPGIVTDEQVAGWRLVTEAVHAEGGRIFLQLFHSGRVGHPDLHGGASPIAPSPVKAETATYTPTSEGMIPVVAPRALTLDEVPQVVSEFATAARRAMEAEFDGVEIHGANGYLPDQFTRDGSNRRDDSWGGSVDRRLRFPLEVARAVAERVGADRVGYRVSPLNPFNDMRDSTPEETFTRLAEGLGRLGLAYLHNVETADDEAMAQRIAASMRRAFKGAGGVALVGNGDYSRELATQRLGAEDVDAVSFGKAFLANPDLPSRFRREAPLNTPDPETFYGGNEGGYTDYPPLAE